MRIRHKKNREARIDAVSDLFATEELIKSISTEINVGKEIRLEIGCGKGSFINETAIKNPEITFFALDRSREIIMLAMEKIKQNGVENAYFINSDVSEIENMFLPNSVNQIYINFCDPWPKKKQEKRRLTSHAFLELYRKMLSRDAKICFKTDNRGLFEYSLQSFADNGYSLDNICFDLHDSELDSTNVRTEYETNFTEKGSKINYLEAKLK